MTDVCVSACAGSSGQDAPSTPAGTALSWRVARTEFTAGGFPGRWVACVGPRWAGKLGQCALWRRHRLSRLPGLRRGSDLLT